MGKLTSPSTIRDIMERYDFSAKKRLGQNFLVDHNVLQKIVAAAELVPDDWVLEIGPGIGTLTQKVAEIAQEVVSIELDKDLADILGETLNQPNIHVVWGDALRLDWLAVLSQHRWEGQRVKLIANLPYYLTTPLIMKALEGQVSFDLVVVMVQREVADRMVAGPGTKEYGLLSLAVQYYSEPEIVQAVSRRVFIPEPNVDSAVVRLRTRQPTVSSPKEPLFQVIKACFAKRRKTITNCLRPLLAEWGITREEYQKVLVELGLTGHERGESLSLERFDQLTLALLSR